MCYFYTMILNYLLPSSLIYKVIKPNYNDIEGIFTDSDSKEYKVNCDDKYDDCCIETDDDIIKLKRIRFNENAVTPIGEYIKFGGFGDTSSIKIERKSIQEDNVKYMQSIHDHIDKNKNEKLKLRGFSNGCNDLMMFLEFLQEHAENKNSEHSQKASDILGKISNVELESPYNNFASSIKPFVTNKWNKQDILGKLAMCVGVVFIPILLPISLINKGIDIHRDIDNSKTLSDEHLYNRLSQFLLQNQNIKGTVKYSVNDPMVGDFGITTKDDNGEYKLKNEFNNSDNITIHVSEENNHTMVRNDYKIAEKSGIDNINPISNINHEKLPLKYGELSDIAKEEKYPILHNMHHKLFTIKQQESSDSINPFLDPEIEKKASSCFPYL